MPDRVYSLAVHPSETQDLVFVGDKSGRIGLWDATHAGESVPAVKKEEDDADEEGGEAEEEESKGRHWVWQGHLKSTVSALKFAPNDLSHIYSSSYDCTLRRTNFEKGISEEVIDGDKWGGEPLLHSFDFSPDGNIIYCEQHSHVVYKPY